ncbi:hypothetical protein RRG08_009968 [Elysia crispata]|uniref:Uncharacterized protein n=1 Tax=Elysia crispata TaxID=231223 RepID=A0AAE1EAE9_9GAST|nr:hypothetical protein RRG08_009968 [Elysia crispata]
MEVAGFTRLFVTVENNPTELAPRNDRSFSDEFYKFRFARLATETTWDGVPDRIIKTSLKRLMLRSIDPRLYEHHPISAARETQVMRVLMSRIGMCSV